MITRPASSAAAAPSSPSARTSITYSTWRFVWITAAAAATIMGLTGAVIAARSIANAEADRSRNAFSQASDETAMSLQTALEDEESLVINASVFVSDNPGVTTERFAQWLRAVQVFERYPELEGVAEVAYVEPPGLEAFIARVAANTNTSLEPDGGEFEIVPPGARSHYCLVEVGSGRDASTTQPPGLDYCASPAVDAAVLQARDSGLSSYRPIAMTTGETLLGVQMPIFAPSAVPTSVEGRRAAFVGVFAMTLDPSLLFDRALAGRTGMAVTMRYVGGGSDVAFSGGTAPSNAQTVTIDLHNGWTVQSFGPAAPGGMFDNANALAPLLGGLFASLMLGVLVYVLGTGRTRALRLVDEKTRELRHRALHDALTDLPNRALIMDRIDQLLARNRRHGTQGAALFVDLDDFKNVNDSLGHAIGDRLLVAVSARLQSSLRDADTIGRMGGDEFVVLIDGATADVSPSLFAERLLDVMHQPFDLEGVAVPLIVNASIGLAVGDRATGVDLLRDADVALYEAKAAGKNRYEIFRTAMQTEFAQRIGLGHDLRTAQELNQLRLVYQPIYKLADLSLLGVEALLRWDHPIRGLVQPDDFIPMLEQTGQIREVGRWVLRHACLQLAAWRARGDTIELSVNVSGRQLDSDDIIDHIREALDASGLDGRCLIIEVTETALMRNAAATATRLHAIRALGVRIAVDDFGTGYSSLGYLQQFPVDCLKIDRMFTSGVDSSPESRALIDTVVKLGHDLGLKTLAEGVETTEQLDRLRNAQVDEAQGFLLARPLDAESLETQILAPARPSPLALDDRHVR
jgi:diguanylate cyclase (GGDEF)-like protein